jgi:predicted HicB family RNase H-like nuclease
VKNNYDRINVTFPKGQKEKIAAAAAAVGESVNGYIKKAIEQRMEKDSQE